MKQVIFIDQPKEQEGKPVEFTHTFDIDEGWCESSIKPSDSEIVKVVYLGNCKLDGDMFAAYHKFGSILIFKGHLNSGKY